MRFFEIIPPNTRVAFIAHRWRYISLSVFLLVLSAASLTYNQLVRGSSLNFGIDFAGGSQVRLELEKDAGLEVDGVREALDRLGYEGASAVVVPDAENELMIRVKDVVSISAETGSACQSAVQQVAGARLLSFHHPEGASKMFLEFDVPVDYGKVEQALNAAGCHGKSDRGFGRPDQVVVEHALLGIGAKLKEQLDGEFGPGTVKKILHSETVGPKVGHQLKVDGVISMIYAIGFIFLYVLLRFDLRFAPGGIVALIHDAFLVVGAFSLTWKEFNLTTVAAILTVIGYSINDTIVVFDRVRERVALFREDDIETTTNAALNETLSRTILTSGTTLLVVLSTWVFGSGTIRDFAFALLVGIGVGTYSSLYIATPVFLWVNRRFYAGKGHLTWLADPKPGERPLLAAAADEVDEETGRTVGDLREEAAGEGDDRGPEGDGTGADGGAGTPGRLRRRRRPVSG